MNVKFDDDALKQKAPSPIYIYIYTHILTQGNIIYYDLIQNYILYYDMISFLPTIRKLDSMHLSG